MMASSSSVERRRENNETTPPVVVDESSLSENHKRVLRVYRKRFDDVARTGRRKPDMIVNSTMREEFKSLPCNNKIHGELDGIPIGLKLNSRGEIAILGIHTRILQGIDSAVHESCYAVCMSGGYKDDDIQSLLFDDNEEGTITYTGSGGRNSKGDQFKDQSLSCDNRSLLSSIHTGKPIRFVVGLSSVVSPVMGQKKKHTTSYQYLGLVKCIGYDMEPSVDGPDVFKFVLQPIHGKFQRPGTGNSRRSSANVMMAHHNPAISNSSNSNSSQRRRNSNRTSGEVRNRLDDKIKNNEQGKIESHTTSNPVSVRRESREVPAEVHNGIISSGQLQPPKNKQLLPRRRVDAAAAAVSGSRGKGKMSEGGPQSKKKKIISSSSTSSNSNTIKSQKNENKKTTTNEKETNMSNKRQGSVVESMTIPSRKKMRKEEETNSLSSSSTARGTGGGSSRSNSAVNSSSSSSSNNKKGLLTSKAAMKRSPPKPVKKPYPNKKAAAVVVVKKEEELMHKRPLCAILSKIEPAKIMQNSLHSAKTEHVEKVPKQVKTDPEKMQNSSVKLISVKQEHNIAAKIKTEELNDQEMDLEEGEIWWKNAF